MSRTPNINSSSWLPLWGSNTPSNTPDNTSKENEEVSSTNSTSKLENDQKDNQDLDLKKDLDLSLIHI